MTISPNGKSIHFLNSFDGTPDRTLLVMSSAWHDLVDAFDRCVIDAEEKDKALEEAKNKEEEGNDTNEAEMEKERGEKESDTCCWLEKIQ